LLAGLIFVELGLFFAGPLNSGGGAAFECEEVAMLEFVIYPPRQRRTIDITPGVRWRRALRVVVATLPLTIALPLLWLFGGLLLLGLLGAASIGITWIFVKLWWQARNAVGQGNDFRNAR
jgi:hypothetical protein